MAFINSRSTIFALVEEVSEGTPVAPSSSADYLALQDGFSISPAFNTIESAELSASIGKSKSVQAGEAPTLSGNHYFRHSGVEGQAPNYGKIIKGALGAVTVASTEYDTVASSTTSVIKVDTGEGANFQRGQALLIKDATNGYSIRCIESVSSDNLTLNFNLATAPSSGVNLGKCVLYRPVDSGHPTFTGWQYYGNKGAIQAVSGLRVTSLGIDIKAGEYINMSYGMDGINYYFDPIEIKAADQKLDFTDDDGTFAATIAVGLYKNPHELADAIALAMNDTASTKVYTVTYLDASGKMKIVGTGTLLTLKWQSGTNTANTIGDKIGFNVGADSSGTGATTGYTSTNAISWASPYTTSYDSSSPLVAKDNLAMIGKADDNLCFRADTVSLNITGAKSDVLSICAASGKAATLISGREVKATIKGALDQNDAKSFKYFNKGDTVKFQYIAGEKVGGNWRAGYCGVLYMATSTISSISITDENNLAYINIELTGHVESGQGEIYAAFV